MFTEDLELLTTEFKLLVLRNILKMLLLQFDKSLKNMIKLYERISDLMGATAYDNIIKLSLYHCQL